MSFGDWWRDLDENGRLKFQELVFMTLAFVLVFFVIASVLAHSLIEDIYNPRPHKIRDTTKE